MFIFNEIYTYKTGAISIDNMLNHFDNLVKEAYTGNEADHETQTVQYIYDYFTTPVAYSLNNEIVRDMSKFLYDKDYNLLSFITKHLIDSINTTEENLSIKTLEDTVFYKEILKYHIDTAIKFLYYVGINNIPYTKQTLRSIDQLIKDIVEDPAYIDFEDHMKSITGQINLNLILLVHKLYLVKKWKEAIRNTYEEVCKQNKNGFGSGPYLTKSEIKDHDHWCRKYGLVKQINPLPLVSIHPETAHRILDYLWVRHKVQDDGESARYTGLPKTPGSSSGSSSPGSSSPGTIVTGWDDVSPEQQAIRNQAFEYGINPYGSMLQEVNDRVDMDMSDLGSSSSRSSLSESDFPRY